MTAGTKTTDAARTIELKDIAFLLPIAGTITALSWETGSFAQIGGHAFEQFSLAEHIVFALPALPFAMIIVLIGSVEAMVIKRERFIAPGRKGHPMDVAIWILAAVNLVAGLYHSIFSLVVMAIALGGLVILFRERPYVLRDYPKAVLLCGLAGLQVVTFVFAMDMTRLTLNDAKNLQVVSLERSVRKLLILRAGEKGILAYDPQTSEFSVLPRDVVKEITWKRAGQFILP
ncbi:MAG: hypothetical protein NVV83_16220 [Afipia sp.]|nr:hypothetical protein [Afipia sp.]